MKHLLLVLVTLLLASCVTRQGEFTLLSSKNAEISRVDLKRVNFTRNVRGTDGRLWILFVPLGSSPHLMEAADECLEAGYGDFMTSAVVYSEFWTILGLVSWESWIIEGDVGDSLSPGAADLPDRQITTEESW